MISHLRRTYLAVAGQFDKEDVLTLIGLALLFGGLWSVSHAGALIAVGAILLWIFLPPRPPFIDPPVRAARTDR